MAVPTAVGVKLTVRFTLDPAATAVDPESPLKLKPEPLMVACETVTAPVPVFVRETVWDADDPTKVFANVRLPALSESR